MKSRSMFLLFLIVLIVSGLLLVDISAPASAQGVVPTPTLINPLLGTTPSPAEDTINFYQVRQTDIQLVGPYDVASLVFGLPATWKLTGSADITLDLNISLSAVQGTSADNGPVGVGGNFLVEFNRNVIGSFPLSQSGDISVRLQVPLDYLASAREDGRQELVFVLDSGFSCLINQHMTVTVRTTSSMTFPHEDVLPSLDLTKFPFPLYQNSIFPDAALIVTPDNPTIEELRSAMTISAGLGRLSGLRMSLDLVTIGALLPAQSAANHIILVGKPETFPLLSQIPFPLQPVDGKFTYQGNGMDDGVIQMVHSPWGLGKVVVLVSGNSDAGVVKAAQALSTGNLRKNSDLNLSIVQDVQSAIQVLPQESDQILSDLGYETTTLRRRGGDAVTIQFYIPPSMTVSPDAYFELIYGHSALLDYNRSGLVVQINSQPVGSVRFSDTTSKNTLNRIQFDIPSSLILPGINILEIDSSLQPLDDCSLPNLGGLWANIWSESHFHLPLVQNLVDSSLVFDLAEFPAPFVFDPSLKTTALILKKDDIESWKSAVQLSAYLGDRGKGSIVLMQTFYADSLPATALADLNMIVLGLAPELPIMTELNNHLPAPFETESGIATEQNMQVTFRIPSDSPVGYVEFLASPWNKRNVVIVAVGNLRQGADWAVSALYTSSLRSQLAGNFAVINDQKITTTDTRVALPIDENPLPTSQASVEFVPPAGPDSTPAVVNRPVWILPVLVITIVLIVAIVVGVIYSASSQKRRSKINVPPHSPNEEGKDL